MKQQIEELIKEAEEKPPICKHETILGGDGYFYCAECNAGKL